jgi:hypothetical protein
MLYNLSWPCVVYIKGIVVAGGLVPKEDFQPPVVGGQYQRFEQASYARWRYFVEAWRTARTKNTTRDAISASVEVLLKEISATLGF